MPISREMMNGRVALRWQFRAIALASLGWNTFGALAYTMGAIREPGYVQSLGPVIIDYLDTMPGWAMAAWGAGTAAALLGSLFLLLRSRFAVGAFGAAVAALAIATLHSFTQGCVVAPDNIWLAIAVGGLVLLGVSVMMRRAGLLR